MDSLLLTLHLSISPSLHLSISICIMWADSPSFISLMAPVRHHFQMMPDHSKLPPFLPTKCLILSSTYRINTTEPLNGKDCQSMCALLHKNIYSMCLVRNLNRKVDQIEDTSYLWFQLTFLTLKSPWMRKALVLQRFAQCTWWKTLRGNMIAHRSCARVNWFLKHLTVSSIKRVHKSTGATWWKEDTLSTCHFPLHFSHACVYWLFLCTTIEPPLDEATACHRYQHTTRISL